MLSSANKQRNRTTSYSVSWKCPKVNRSVTAAENIQYSCYYFIFITMNISSLIFFY